MPKQNYRELPKVRDSLSYLYLENGKVEQTKTGIEFFNKEGAVPVPVSTLSLLMLGPGTSITHSALKTIAQSGCMMQWTGQEAVRYYAHSTGETYKAYKLEKQAALVSDEEKRRQVALRLYQYRFKEKFPKNASIKELQGIEGKKVKLEYEMIAEKYGVTWNGRWYNRNDWNDGDIVNKALSTANSCLYGICHSAIIAAGYSAGLGFIHRGKQLSFVYDIADLYKLKITVPVAFATAAESPFSLEREVRMRCRQTFKNMKLLKRILPDIEKILNIDEELPDGFDPDDDPALPTPWWIPPEEDE